MPQHDLYHFSVTIHSDDLTAVYALRGLSQRAQRTGNARIPWGGTKRSDWERAGHHVTFHFSEPEYRVGFIRDAKRLLPEQIFTVVRERDDHPATPQS
jgi:hypothetical protein